MNHLIWVGGGISYRISNDPGIESAIPDFIIRTESAKNDLFSKFRLHSLYDLSFTYETGEDFQDGWLPTLDTNMVVDPDNKVLYKYF